METHDFHEKSSLDEHSDFTLLPLIIGDTCEKAKQRKIVVHDQ
jgi:hypothetical protein